MARMSRVIVLDHGYIEPIEHWGSDERIIEAARMSTGKGFLGWGPETQCEYCGGYEADSSSDCAGSFGGHNFGPFGKPGDEKLLRFLWENRHHTPFEMAGLTFEIKAPIFVFREWHRHRTQSYNEMSARYTPLPNENYIPSVERLMLNASGTNRQAGTVAGADALTVERADRFRSVMQTHYDECELIYQDALRDGVPKELARIHLPVGRYSRMRASANLRNWIGFLTLRLDSAAQWEIRQFAIAVGQAVAERFPRTWILFSEKQR